MGAGVVPDKVLSSSTCVNSNLFVSTLYILLFLDNKSIYRFFTTTLITHLYVRIGIVLTRGKDLNDCIISIRGTI